MRPDRRARHVSTFTGPSYDTSQHVKYVNSFAIHRGPGAAMPVRMYVESARAAPRGLTVTGNTVISHFHRMISTTMGGTKQLAL